MCWYVYIATREPLKTVIFTEDLPKTGEQPPPLHFRPVIEDEMELYGNLFKGNNLYYVGSDTGCSCGLECSYITTYLENGDIEKELNGVSPIALLEFLKNYTQKETLEMYAVYETQYAQLPLHHVTIPIKKNAPNDFVELKTRQFYTFYSD